VIVKSCTRTNPFGHVSFDHTQPPKREGPRASTKIRHLAISYRASSLGRAQGRSLTIGQTTYHPLYTSPRSVKATHTMPIYSFYIFDRHCTFPSPPSRSSFRFRQATNQTILTTGECIYKRQWLPRDQLLPRTPTTPNPPNTGDRRTSLAPSTVLDGAAAPELRGRQALSNKDDTKLVFGVIFSLRNMVRKLSGP
jgi:hypothetical protein